MLEFSQFLQGKLPRDVKLLCCMTCRHGNMCPFGNEPRELYCTKNIKVNNKNQLAELFNENKINQDNKAYCDYYCNDYEKHYLTFHLLFLDIIIPYLYLLSIQIIYLNIHYIYFFKK